MATSPEFADVATPVGGSFDPLRPFRSDVQPASEFDGVATPVGSTPNAMSAVGEGLAGGFVRNVGVLPAMTAGALGGAAVAGIPGAIIGGLGAGGYAMWAGNEAAKGLKLRRPEEMPPGDRKFGYWGESFGGSVGSLVAPYSVANTAWRVGGTSNAGKFLDSMLDSIKAAPVRYAMTEGVMASSAASGAFAAEAIFPGNQAARVNAEFFAGTVNPASLVRMGAEFGWRSVRKVYQGISPEGRMTAAGKLLRQAMDLGDEPDISVVHAAYKAAGIIDLKNPEPIQGKAIKGLQNMHIGQLTGSKGIAILIKHLEDTDPKFAAENNTKLKQGLEVLQGHIALLTLTGDPEALKAAAEIRSAYYRSLIHADVDKGLREATVAMGAITKDTPKVRLDLSNTVKTKLDGSVQRSRAIMNEKWSAWTAVEGNNASGFENFQRQFNEEYAKVPEVYRKEIVPAPIEEFFRKMNAKPKVSEELSYDPTTLSFKTTLKEEKPGTTVNEMYQFRSIFLAKSREAAHAGRDNESRQYSNLAESILDDLDGAMTPAGKTAYDDARGFTREFHNAFTRSFVGQADAVGKYGDRVQPEILLRRAFATGKEIGYLQLLDIENATRFLTKRGVETPNDVDVVMDAQNRFIRLAAADYINPRTGKLNQDGLAKFMHDNEAIMDRFPGIKDDLGNALKTTREVERLELMMQNKNRLMEDTKVFSKIVKNDGIAVAQSALTSNNMQRDIEAMVTMATKGTVGKDGKPLFDVPAATAGLRASIYTAAINLSRGASRTGQRDINMDAVKNLLYSALPGKRSAMQILQDSGVVSTREAGKIKLIFDTLGSIQQSADPGTMLAVKPDMTDTAMAIVSRIAGSGTLSFLSQKSPVGSGHGLIVAQAGSRFGEWMFKQLSVETARAMLIDAISDPSSGKLDLIMQSASRMTPKDVHRQATQLNAYRMQVMTGTVGDLSDDENYTGPGTKRDIK
jgi:hypothetical protein